MKSYWLSLTRREQNMIAAGCGLIVLTLLYFAALAPLMGYVRDSERAYASSLSNYQSIQSYASQLLATRAGRPQSAGEGQPVSLRVAVSNAARMAGVSISRLQPSEDGTLTVWAENVDSQQFFLWLKTLSDERGIGPANVLVQKSTSGDRLRVQLRFVETDL